MSHSRTHRARLARRLATETGLGYQQALSRVRAAAEAGRLPGVLDEAGLAAAVEMLAEQRTHTGRFGGLPHRNHCRPG